MSVLFADLVGFTTLSESRDPEEVRELLSRYFDICRRLVTLYGGVVEKFIGDAVMAVWGTPIAQEDDAERAVRAALDLVAAVTVLGEEVGAPALRARAGVMSGEAAVTIGAKGEGMVAGDLVNTASRVQAEAAPGSVLVGDATKRASQAAIEYADDGLHQMKGKAEPLPLYRALRVTAGRKGAQKTEAMEPPFVGRDAELRLLKELFHATADQSKAHLMSVVGIAGIGKSRLAWEFFKYVDGLATNMWWWQGRCLAYGEGVTYWALAEMIRTRADIVEGEAVETARPKLAEALQPYIADAEERAWIEPRLAQLLGLEEGAGARDDLFAAWRLYFERLSEHQPAVLVFEDMQWADTSLLEFVEYLLEWSRNHPIFVLTLARPELLDRHSDWSVGKRNFSSHYLEPLSEAAMEKLLDGLAPGLPDELRARILQRAEGVPLYAVETMRMLLDRGLLEAAGDSYRPTGPIESLDVPETLHSLVAARLDGLATDERTLLQHAAVLGKTFTRQALAALTGAAPDDSERLLSSLMRKEVLSLQADPRSPERGQFAFVQDLLRQVAYDTLSRHHRKQLHLRAGEYLEEVWGPAESEIAEIVASHYLAAVEAVPDAQDATAISSRAQVMLTRAGERAASLAASDEALRYFERAAELAQSPGEQASLLERAGQMAFRAGKLEPATMKYELALNLLQGADMGHQAARVAARLGEAEYELERLHEAIQRMEQAFVELQGDEPDADTAALAAQLGRAHAFSGDLQLANDRSLTALDLAESLWLPEVLAQALITRGVIAAFQSRLEEAIGLTRHALALAHEHDLPAASVRASNNLGWFLDRRDKCVEAAAEIEQGLALARRIGDRVFEQYLLGELGWSLSFTGNWSEAIELMRQLPEEGMFVSRRLGLLDPLVALGRLDEARSIVREESGSAADTQERWAYHAGVSVVRNAEGRPAEALAAAQEALTAFTELGTSSEPVKVAFPHALEAALALHERGRAEQLLQMIESLPPGHLAPSLAAHCARFRARLAAADGDQQGAGTSFAAAVSTFRKLGWPFWLAIALTEQGEWLARSGSGPESERALTEAAETFARLQATAWRARAEAALADGRSIASAS